MRLLLDEHLSPRIATELRRSGHDAIAIAERPDLRGRSDEDIIDVAVSEGRAFVTFDVVDHLRIHGIAARLGRPHPGLVALAPSTWRPSNEGIGGLVRALADLLTANLAENSLHGRVVWLEPPGGPVEPEHHAQPDGR
jgi:predicted nuclease of predicted toxin-antitoxin system